MKKLMLTIVVLAAGKGTRMRSAVPKVLHRLGGLPLIEHVLRAAETLSPRTITVVVGHQADLVEAHLKGRAGVRTVRQEPQLGTGHALLICEPLLHAETGTVVLLSGDVPLLTPASLASLLARHRDAGAAATVVTAMVERPSGYGRIVRSPYSSARIVRIDRDSARRRAELVRTLDAIRSGEGDILVGTQLLAKGHDFPNLTLVGVLNADAALVSTDYRAAERLFAVLSQVAGRAGRRERPGEVLVQTRYPGHPLFAALARHDFAGFAESQLEERAAAGFPPFVFEAALRAEASKLELAILFLRDAAAIVEAPDGVRVFDPVPNLVTRRAGLERAQLLVQSRQRPALQAFGGIPLEIPRVSDLAPVIVERQARVVAAAGRQHPVDPVLGHDRDPVAGQVDRRSGTPWRRRGSRRRKRILELRMRRRDEGHE